MRRFGRPLVTLCAAVALPLLLLLGLQVNYAVEQRRAADTRAGLARAEEIVLLLDERVQAEERLMQVLATATAIKAENWPAAYVRAHDVANLGAAWRGVVLSDVHGGEIFDTRRPFSGQRQPTAPRVTAALKTGLARPIVDDVTFDADGRASIYVHVPVKRDGVLVGVLSVALDPGEFQTLLVQRADGQGVSAVVDRSGAFIARTKDYANRVGKPATAYVRAAIRGGVGGVYKGKTYEGLVNYTSFHTSPITGWSAHLAVDSSPIDRSRQWSVLSLIGIITIFMILAITVVVLTLRDFADRVAAEDRLRQAQKMEAVGRLTGGIAHDFNNLLTAIIGGLELARGKLAPNDPSRRYLDAATQAANRGAKLTSQLLAFSRTQRLEVKRIDLTGLLAGMQDLLEQSLGPRVGLTVEVAAGAEWVTTDANQLELALLNLAVNARDAMSDDGHLDIRAMVSKQDDGMIDIAVRDDGAGMTKVQAEHALEPFFTTKEPGKGTGLGLSQVYGLAQQSHGAVTIETKRGVGTTVHLMLPRGAAQAEAGPVAAPGSPTPAVRDARILLLDDEGGVRIFMAETLRQAGYTVLEFADGEGALSRIADFDPDLMIVDYVMPGMNGAEAARRARLVRPDLRILVVSGYADSDALTAAIGDAPLLRKPFDGATLTRAVGDSLAARRPDRLPIA